MDSNGHIQPVPNDDDHDFLARLTPKMQKFAEYYAVNQNILRSTILAGYSAKNTGYGHALLKNPDVQHAVAYYQMIHTEKSLYTPDKLVRQWALMASIDLTELMNADYTLRPLDELTEEQRAHLAVALVGFDAPAGGRRQGARARFAKVEALENLGKLMKLYDKDKTDGEGLILNINVGQHMTVEATEADLGPFTLRFEEPQE
jgi:hypothetical protein